MSVRLHGTFGSWLLPEGETVLGRGATASLRIDDPRLSRAHARFHLKGHELRVDDLGATNGVLVDSVRINGTQMLRHGAVVVCGPVVLMVSFDQTAPHPRTTQGEQNPTTRREVSRVDTESLQAIAADRPSSASRGLNPAIAAAISSGEFDPSRQSSLTPAEFSPSGTSPLAAFRPGEKSGNTPLAHRSPTTSSSQLPPTEAPTSSGALEAPRHPPSAGNRLLAGVGDGVLVLLAQIPALAVIACGYGVALRFAGAVLVSGLPRLVPGEPAETWALTLSLGNPGGLERMLELLPTLSRQTSTFAIMVGAIALAALLAAGAWLFLFVVATAGRGAPLMHRRCGLTLVRAGADGALGWPRVICRWGLASILWPLAIPAAVLGFRAPHDILSGCRLARTR